MIELLQPLLLLPVGSAAASAAAVELNRCSARHRAADSDTAFKRASDTDCCADDEPAIDALASSGGAAIEVRKGNMNFSGEKCWGRGGSATPLTKEGLAIGVGFATVDAAAVVAYMLRYGTCVVLVAECARSA